MHHGSTDDNRAFAAKLEAAGREVMLSVSPRMPHGFYFFAHLLPKGRRGLRGNTALLPVAMTEASINALRGSHASEIKQWLRCDFWRAALGFPWG
ncbi:hypothetical protein [Kaistia soli]|uniref:hypothetical protein n=1 Tax=Kaistia soli TaxID=446684 RepID=UPI00093308E8|nr:hypothetical protein [Kaistia soli]